MIFSIRDSNAIIDSQGLTTAAAWLNSIESVANKLSQYFML
nr:hypothetical protein [Phytobacter sp.]